MSGRRSRKNSKRGMLVKSGFFLYLGLSLFAIIWLKAGVVNLEYELGKLEKLRTDLLTERDMITAQKESYFSMSNVEKVAMKKLGMINADRDDIFFVTRTSTAGPRVASMN